MGQNVAQTGQLFWTGWLDPGFGRRRQYFGPRRQDTPVRLGTNLRVRQSLTVASKASVQNQMFKQVSAREITIRLQDGPSGQSDGILAGAYGGCDNVIAHNLRSPDEFIAWATLQSANVNNLLHFYHPKERRRPRLGEPLASRLLSRAKMLLRRTCFLFGKKSRTCSLAPETFQSGDRSVDGRCMTRAISIV